MVHGKRFNIFQVKSYREQLVPEGGLEPPHSQGASDFESDASTSSTTPARGTCNIRAPISLQALAVASITPTLHQRPLLRIPIFCTLEHSGQATAEVSYGTPPSMTDNKGNKPIRGRQLQNLKRCHTRKSGAQKFFLKTGF
jgi:hypothetical protein